MGGERSGGSPPKRVGAPVGKPVIKTNVLRDLKEERVRRDAAKLARDSSQTIAHIDDVAKLGNEVYRKQNAVLDAATTGNDPKINDLAHKKAELTTMPRKKSPNIECSGGVCRIVRKKKK